MRRAIARAAGWAAALLMSSAGLSGPVLGEEPPGVAQDEVVLELTVEDWVETETATVVVAVDMAITAGSFGAARQAVEADLKAVADTVIWRLTRFTKLRDEAGYERWRLLAEARVPGAVLAGLGAAVAGASGPGREFRIHAIDYAPTLAEREAALAKLRIRVYERANQELAALNQVFADRAFRLGAIEFVPRSLAGRPVMDGPQSAQVLARQGKSTAAPAAVAEKLVINATVTLSALAPEAR